LEYESFVGIRFTDEDGYRQFSSAAAAKKVFDEVCADKVFSHNLVSMMANKLMLDYGYSHIYMASGVPITEQVRAGGYEYYLNKEVEMVNPSMMSYDGYPFPLAGKVLATLHTNLKTVDDVARAHGKCSWAYPQAFGGEPNDFGEMSRIPHYNEIEYQIGVMLGMGAKGLVLYPYFTPPELASSQVKYMHAFGLDGKPTQMYYDFKAVFENVKGYQHILMDSVTKGALVGGDKGKVTQRPNEDMVLDSFNELQGVGSQETGVVAYCMNYQGKSAIYVQNADIEKDGIADLTLSFSKSVEVTVYRDAKEMKMKGKHINLYDVPAGQAIMVVVG
jgi:hypothetical protein